MIKTFAQPCLLVILQGCAALMQRGGWGFIVVSGMQLRIIDTNKMLKPLGAKGPWNVCDTVSPTHLGSAGSVPFLCLNMDNKTEGSFLLSHSRGCKPTTLLLVLLFPLSAPPGQEHIPPAPGEWGHTHRSQGQAVIPGRWLYWGGTKTMNYSYALSISTSFSSLFNSKSVTHRITRLEETSGSSSPIHALTPQINHGIECHI